MKISMYILEKWFKEAGFHTYSAIVEGNARLVGARIAEENQSDAIARVAMKDDNSGLVAIVNRNDILFVSNTSSSIVLNTASEAFEFYNYWEMCLLRSAFEKSSLQDMLDIAVLAIHRPMLIKNSHKELCAFTSSYGAYVHPLWEEYLKLKKLPAPVYDYGKPYNDQADFSEQAEPTVGYSPSYQGNFLFANLIVDGHRLGHISAYEHNRPFDKGDIQIMSILQKIITFYISANREALYSDSPTSDFLHAALTDDKHSTSTPEELMAQNHWTLEDNLVLFILYPKDSIPVPIINGQVEVLNQALPHLTQTSLGQYFVFLINLRELGSYEDLNNTMKQVVDSNNFHWAVSNPFHGLSSLKGHYNATKYALNHGIQNQLIGARVYCIAAVYWKNKLNVSPEDLVYWGHPAYAFLEQYDHKNETRYLETFFWYLYYNRNLMNASTRMGLHRNTVNNWVLKIFEQLGYDSFDRPQERLSFLLTYLFAHEITDN